jgi:hypothetical protein
MTKKRKLVTESGLCGRMQNVIDEAARVTTRKRNAINDRNDFTGQSCLGRLLLKQQQSHCPDPQTVVRGVLASPYGNILATVTRLTRAISIHFEVSLSRARRNHTAGTMNNRAGNSV